MDNFKYLKPHPRRSAPPTFCAPPTGDRYNYPGACIPELCGLARQAGPLDPSLKHLDLRSSRVEGVGNWLLQADEFINWDTGEDGVANPVLFCYGDPEVGKTHIGYELAFYLVNGGG